ncbi:MAG: hypothetical protein WAS23_08525 [Dokdonella sp.]|uniref:hypothetical protein n=1 Tax=Dokdonella sp. TaxID=2291710 RepID=UPI003BB008C0
MRTGHFRRNALTSALAATLALIAPALHAQGGSVSIGWLQLIGLIPAPAYDPYESQIPRRRPGHPPEALPMWVEQNPDALNPAPVDQVGNFVPVPDRWRIMESLGVNTPWYDPYNQNVLKGDKPMFGDSWFFSMTGISDTLLEPRGIPTPVGPQSGPDAGSNDVLGNTDQLIFAQTAIPSFLLYEGDTSFKPPDIEFKATLAFNYNRVRTEEVRALQVDPTYGRTRDDGFVGVQELFVTKDLRTVSARYDVDEVRVGIQPFSSDFRGFLFQDNQLGVRFFGNRDNNYWQYNLAWFRRLEKDINSGLNDLSKGPRKDDVFLASLYRQDFPFTGFVSQAIFAYNRNREDSSFYDSNGFIQRPAAIGREFPRTYDVGYLGYNGDGHFGRLNLTVSAYAVVGKQKPGVFVAQDTDVRAGFLAAEASMDFDWIRLRGSLAWASGDDDAYDDRSTGYDAIFENPIFAGADTSYWIRQNLPLIGGGGVALAGRNGLLANLHSSKEQGQSNFDNPGLQLIGIGADFDVTPQSRISTNINELWFDDTEILKVARATADVGRNIGTDLSVAWTWRPQDTQNIILRLSAATLLPGQALKDLYGTDTRYYTVLGNMIFTY